ncbi:MAG: cation-transporting ATPase [Pseudonocardiaceae bacterium]|nr:cation-transporting ATPase [Pseudonocardiaceae bacterium]
MADTVSAQDYTVTGMSCQHCVNAVTAEVSGIDGVTGVDIDLDSGRMRVHSERQLDDDKIRAAVDEAGYEIRA